jgi:hypothetical protein
MVRQPQTLWPMSVAGVEVGGRAVALRGISSGQSRDAHWPPVHWSPAPATEDASDPDAGMRILPMLSTRCDSAMSIASAPRVCGRAVSARPTAAPSEARSSWVGLPLCVVPSPSPPPKADITRLAHTVRRRARRRGDLSLWETRGNGSAAENSLHAQRRLIGGLIQALTPFERCLRPAKATLTSRWTWCLRLPAVKDRLFGHAVGCLAERQLPPRHSHAIMRPHRADLDIRFGCAENDKG